MLLFDGFSCSVAEIAAAFWSLSADWPMSCVPSLPHLQESPDCVCSADWPVRFALPAVASADTLFSLLTPPPSHSRDEQEEDAHGQREAETLHSCLPSCCRLATRRRAVAGRARGNRQRSARVIDGGPVGAARPQLPRNPDAPPQPGSGENDETCQRCESDEESAGDDSPRARGPERLARLPPLEWELLPLALRALSVRARRLG